MSGNVLARRPVGPPAGQCQVRAGSAKSNYRLDRLRYDPIGELVEMHRELKKEVKRQEDIRDGRIVELNGNGKPRAYRAEIHHALFDKMISISEKLLRYKYGRVPEIEVKEARKTAPLIVNLTKAGDTYVINGSDDDGFIEKEFSEYLEEEAEADPYAERSDAYHAAVGVAIELT